MTLLKPKNPKASIQNGALFIAIGIINCYMALVSNLHFLVILPWLAAIVAAVIFGTIGVLAGLLRLAELKKPRYNKS